MFRSLYAHIHPILSRTVETLHKTNVTVLSDVLICSHSADTLPSAHHPSVRRRREWRERNNSWWPVFPFLLCHCFQCEWSAHQGSSARRTMIGLLGPLCFFKHHCCLSALGAQTVSNRKRGLLGPSGSPPYSGVDVTYSHGSSSSLSELLWVSPLLTWRSIIASDFTYKRKFNHETIKSFKVVTAEH